MFEKLTFSSRLNAVVVWLSSNHTMHIKVTPHRPGLVWRSVTIVAF